MNRTEKRMKVGVITDGKYGERAFENIKKHFEVEWILVPDIPPSVMLDDEIDLSIPECDVYLSYVRHPDIILDLVALQKPLILGITPGLGLFQQAKKINPKVVSPRTMCSLEQNTGIPEIDSFAEHFGKPLFETDLNEDMNVLNAKILRSSPCGSSAAGADFMRGKNLNKKNLQDFALRVCHECRAPRFGYTCDKEVSGIIHILSFINSINSEYESFMDEDLMEFTESIKKEYENRSKIEILST